MWKYTDTFWQNTRLPKKIAKNLIENERAQTIKIINTNVDAKGFYLYHWLTKDDFQAVVKEDYFKNLQNFGVIMLGISLLIGVFCGAMFSRMQIWGLPASKDFSIILASISIVVTLITSNIVLLVFLLFKSFFRGQIFAKNADVVILDDYISVSHQITKKTEFNDQSPRIQAVENIFAKPLFSNSFINEKIEKAKTGSPTNLVNLIKIGEKIMQNSNSYDCGYWKDRNTGTIMILFVIAGTTFFVLNTLMYYLFLPFASAIGITFSRFFSFISYLKNKTEYQIQEHFVRIDENIINQDYAKQYLLSSLEEAKSNQWLDNLSGKIQKNFETFNTFVKDSTNQSIALRKLLGRSKYQDIFRFEKLNWWLRNEVLWPVQELITLIHQNIDIIEKSAVALQMQIDQTAEPSIRTPLELQKKRFESQKNNFEKMLSLLESYQKKLIQQ